MTAPEPFTNRDALAYEVAGHAHAIIGQCLAPATEPGRSIYLRAWHERRAMIGAPADETARLAPAERVGLVVIPGGGA